MRGRPDNNTPGIVIPYGTSVMVPLSFVPALRIRVGSARRQTHLLPKPGNERLPARITPESDRAEIIWRARDERRSPLFECLVEKPERLIHSTESRVYRCKTIWRDVAFLGHLLHLGENLEGVTSAPR
jgi:hypothetical protein